jgi:hypothetical protein
VTTLFAIELSAVGLKRGKRTMEKSIVHYIGFPVLTIHNPVALQGVAGTGLGNDRLRSIALGRIYDERPKRSKSIHKALRQQSRADLFIRGLFP